ncbi:hypothetical protein [Nocardia sp. NPDC050412]|uniref:hypothetical protein n=1 Tax=Nocardia sp. NPDC050412 TaxID=3364320 RepID=UPI0037A8374F
MVDAAVAASLDRADVDQLIEATADRKATSTRTAHARGDRTLHIAIQRDRTQTFVVGVERRAALRGSLQRTS